MEATEEQRCSAQDRNAVARHKGEGWADLFLAYCTIGNAAAAELPDLQVLTLPEQFGVGADYGLALPAAPPEQQAAAAHFAMFVLARGAGDPGALGLPADRGRRRVTAPRTCQPPCGSADDAVAEAGACART